jgi:hypothetical protein
MNNLSLVERYILNRIAKRIVRQSRFHEGNIILYFKILHKAAMLEFFEDNKPTLDGFLQDCLVEALTNESNRGSR